MTDARATQAPVLGVLTADPDAQIAGGAVLAVYTVGSPAWVLQGAVLGVYSVVPDVRYLQTPVLAVYKGVPCSTRFSQIWTIARTDGEVFRFTSLDRDLVFGGATYKACGSLTPSASESSDEVGSVGDMELAGVLADEAITGFDLDAGLFDGASVEAWLVDRDLIETPKALLRGIIGKVTRGEFAFHAELLGDGAKLTQTPLTRTIKPGCDYQFGDAFCGKDLGPLTVTGTVDSGAGQRTFTDAARAEAAGYFKRGRVVFTTGLNAGVGAEIKEHAAGGVFDLWPRLANPIAAGDAYSMTPGCTNLKDASGGCNGCIAWDNVVNYPGFDGMPGGDAISSTSGIRTS